LLVAATVDFLDTIQAHILKSWNVLILQMDGFLATYKGNERLPKEAAGAMAP
jgi:hypothetical protein